MLPLTQNPSLSPAMRLQPAMGNADYCCYSIRQSACVCMCVCVCMRVCVCVCAWLREMERERERMGIIPDQVLSASHYPLFGPGPFSHMPHLSRTTPGLWISPSCRRQRLPYAALQRIDFFFAAFHPISPTPLNILLVSRLLFPVNKFVQKVFTHCWLKKKKQIQKHLLGQICENACARIHNVCHTCVHLCV